MDVEYFWTFVTMSCVAVRVNDDNITMVEVDGGDFAGFFVGKFEGTGCA